MSRMSQGGGVRNLQARNLAFILSPHGDPPQRRAPAGNFLYVCQDKECDLRTRLRESGKLNETCCGEEMLCRKIGLDNWIVPITGHTQNIWVCATCEISPRRDTKPRGVAECRHAFVVYAKAAADSH
ncbi:hypothetical protein QFZ24_004048 [Streptomyces phaeochromogenes]|uniref:hypothetical protein n=1 Tax=Streptomyces phaeochromogenes TaxID=1923 RepID=UPI0027951A3B|nr:hypothetical protein [Streptomyces phaeochromogenes]MDQ0950125.1 hypothetical protein [Streptomyces phaeochromogenes]WRZ29800.1 hypothetical protein OG931_19605 [Streptomyces phaeochromogenes]